MANKSTANTNKRYFYLQIGDEFLNDAVTRAIEKKLGGDGFALYERILFQSVQYGDEGKVFYLGTEDTIQEEIADSTGYSVDLVTDLLKLLERTKDITVEKDEEGQIQYIDFPIARDLTGSIGSSGLRMRRKRARDKNKASQSDDINNDNDNDNDKENNNINKSESGDQDFYFDTEEEEEEDLPDEDPQPIEIFNDTLKSRGLPNMREVREYCYNNDLNVNPDWYFKKMCLCDWKDQNGKPIKSWKKHIEKYSAGIEEKKIDDMPFDAADIYYYLYLCEALTSLLHGTIEDEEYNMVINAGPDKFNAFIYSGTKDAEEIKGHLDELLSFSIFPAGTDLFNKHERYKTIYFIVNKAEQHDLRMDVLDNGNTDSSIRLMYDDAEEELFWYMVNNNSNNVELLKVG